MIFLQVTTIYLMHGKHEILRKHFLSLEYERSHIVREVWGETHRKSQGLIGAKLETTKCMGTSYVDIIKASMLQQDMYIVLFWELKEAFILMIQKVFFKIGCLGQLCDNLAFGNFWYILNG